jgi:hypothetical protein
MEKEGTGPCVWSQIFFGSDSNDATQEEPSFWYKKLKFLYASPDLSCDSKMQLKLH